MQKFKPIPLFLLILVFIFINNCQGPNKEHQNEIESFQKKRINYLQSRKGYLNLVGLYWIFEGNYILGSNKDSGIILPKKFPNEFGRMDISEDSIKFEFIDPVLVDSSQFLLSFNYAKSQLGHHFSWGPFQWFIIKRGQNYALRVKDFQNPLIRKIDEIPSFDPDISWRIKGIFKPYAHQKMRTISNIWGHAVTQPTAGTVTFKYNDKKFELESNIESNKLAVIFKDGTTGDQTYSGGRQLYLTDPDEKGNVILDFNKSFNFPCAFNDFTTCPVPPENNHLPFSIFAGEKYYFKK